MFVEALWGVISVSALIAARLIGFWALFQVVGGGCGQPVLDGCVETRNLSAKGC